MKKILLLLFCLATFTWLPAATLIDGLYYNLNTSAKTAEVTKDASYSDLTGILIIPATVDYQGTTYKVTSIGSAAFSGCNNITGLEIGENVSTIGESAFARCTGLEGTLNIPANVKTIYTRAFQSCSGLTILIFNGYCTIGSSDNSGYGYTFYDTSIRTIFCFAENPPGLFTGTSDQYGNNPSSYNFKNYSKIDVYVPLDYYPSYLTNYTRAFPPFRCYQGWSEFNLIPITSTETTSITLNKNSLTMEVGDDETLTATVEPFYTEDALSWSVWPEDVVSVEDGKVVALKPGYAVITVKSGNISATCNVEVIGDMQGGGTEGPNSDSRILFMEPGQQLDIRSYFDYTKEVQPLAVLMDYYEFESSDPEVVDGVSQDGGFEAKNYGMATLKVSYINKMEDTKTVNDFMVFVCPTVTVQHGSGAIYSHHVVYNSAPTLSLNAGNGYRIAGATHGKTDIYDEIMANDGKYVPAEPITSNSVINLALEETDNGPTTGADAVFNDPNIRILVNGHTVNIVGVDSNTVVRMYNIAGAKLFDEVNYPNIEVIDAGVYIVEIDGQPNTYKIVVR